MSKLNRLGWRRKMLMAAAAQGGGDSWVTPADIPADEAAMLKVLYDAAGGDEWTNHTNWGLTTTAANWNGLTVVGGHVTIINISNNHAIGDISAWNPSSFTVLEDIYFQTNAGLIGSVADWDIPATMENIQIHASGLSGSVAGWVLPAPLVALRLNNTAVSGDISGWSLPAGLQNFVISSCQVSGDISGWTIPSTALVSFQLSSTQVTGSMNGWALPATLQYFYAADTALTGVPTITALTAIREIQVYGCALTQANVDAWVQALYNRRAGITYNTPALFIHDNNAAPSGVYQDADPPTTGKEFIYELKNDPDAEGFKKWTVFYTGAP